jgi:hypothetical protein
VQQRETFPPAQQVVPAVQQTAFDPLPHEVPWVLGMQVLVLGLQHWFWEQSRFVVQGAGFFGWQVVFSPLPGP